MINWSEVAARFLTVTQAGAPLRITGVTVRGKKLFVTGEGFAPGAVIFLYAKEYKTRNDDQYPETALVAKKAGKKVNVGDKLQVRNPDSSLSEEFIFTGQ